MSKATSMGRILVCLILLATVNTEAAPSHKGMSFQGVIKLPSGEYPTRTGLSINAKILSPNNCILREELFTGVTLENGYLNLAVGTGTVGGSNPGLTLAQVMDNSQVMNGLVCLNGDGSLSATTSYNPLDAGLINHARKFRLTMTIDAIPVVADFNMRAVPYAVNSETLDGKSKSEFLQTTASLTQQKLEDFITSLTSTTGNAVKWNGSNFVSYNPNDGTNITDLGTVTSGTWNGSTIGITHGGTGATTAAGARTSLGLTDLATMATSGTPGATNFLRGDGAWTAIDLSTKVSKTGDTMTGALNLPSNGLTVGTTELAVSGGNVSVGGNLSTAGRISLSKQAHQNGLVTATGNTFDADNGNKQKIAPTAAAITTSNLQIGGEYTLIVTETTPREYTFSSCVTAHYLPPSAATTDGKKTIYSILYSATNECYITWASGY